MASIGQVRSYAVEIPKRFGPNPPTGGAKCDRHQRVVIAQWACSGLGAREGWSSAMALDPNAGAIVPIPAPATLVQIYHPTIRIGPARHNYVCRLHFASGVYQCVHLQRLGRLVLAPPLSERQSMRRRNPNLHLVLAPPPSWRPQSDGAPLLLRPPLLWHPPSWRPRPECAPLLLRPPLRHAQLLVPRHAPRHMPSHMPRHAPRHMPRHMPRHTPRLREPGVCSWGARSADGLVAVSAGAWGIGSAALPARQHHDHHGKAVLS